MKVRLVPAPFFIIIFDLVPKVLPAPKIFVQYKQKIIGLFDLKLKVRRQYYNH
jgi:hypothetical protein